MAKGKKSKKKSSQLKTKPTATQVILLITAILNLIKIVYDLIKDILN